MSDYISREAAIGAANEIAKQYGHIGCTEGFAGATAVKFRLEKLPAADVAPVVRCGACKRRVKSADLTDTVLCLWFGQHSMNKTDYCSYGEQEADHA